MYTGGDINGPTMLAIDNVNNVLYVLNVGGSAPGLVKIDLKNNGTQTLLATYTGGSLANPVSLAFDSTSGVLYLADEGPAGISLPRLGTIDTVDLRTGNLNALPSPNNMLDHIEDLGFDGNGHLLAFIAGSGGGVIQVDPQTGNQTSLVSGLFLGTNLVLNGGTVDLHHGGRIYVSAYDPTGFLPSQLVSIDPISQAVNTLTMGGNLSLVTGLTAFSVTGAGAAEAPSPHSGPGLHGGVTALVHRGQPVRPDPSSGGTSLASTPAEVPAQLPGIPQPLAKAVSAVAVPRAATDSLFADWDGSLTQATFADTILTRMTSGLAT
jgi:hypothetical protein